MARTASVSLDDHLADFVDDQVDKGLYQSPSDVVRAGLQLLEEHAAKVKALEQALIEGEESGEPTAFDPAAFLDDLHRKYAR